MKKKDTKQRSNKKKLTDSFSEDQSTLRVKKQKSKYRHMNYWLEDLDDEYVPPNYKDEEE